MTKISRKNFIFRKHETIGAEGAEQDRYLLFNCFVDTGDLAVLRDTEKAKCIVVGRTGSGKTALLMLLNHREEHVINLEPDHLSLNYLTNSTILSYLEGLGVNLDIFYRLLWKHIFVIELIKIKYKIKSETDQNNFLTRIFDLFFKDKKKKDALDYLIHWGKHFWKDTEYRIHEVTQKLEKDIKAAIGTKIKFLNGNISASDKISSEDKFEIIHRAQEVVNSIQIQKLARVIDILAEDIFSETYPKFYIVIDRLDENWVDDRLRYKLIRALIETLKDLQKFKNAKLIIALRQDLLYRVFRETRDSGFQEEKYESLIFKLKWNEHELLEILNKRLNMLIRKQYTSEPIFLKDLFPKKIKKENTGKYIVNRTMYRPRDIIQFGNCCVEAAINRSDISVALLKKAESKYSTLRFRSLADEWIVDYPNLLPASEILKRKPPIFPVTDLVDREIENICLEAFDSDIYDKSGKVNKWAKDVFNDKMDLKKFRLRLVKMFYETGIVGIKISKGAKTSWSFIDGNIIREAEINENIRLEICPIFYRVLGTVFRNK